jgi:hypothetical protein
LSQEDFMTEHKNRKRLIRERQARSGESYTAARRHLTPTEPVVVLAEMDIGDTTVRAVRDPVGDVQLRLGDDTSGQPVVRHRPTPIIIDDPRVLAFGLVTAPWEGTGHMRNTRWGHGSSGPGRAFVCRVCGHEERLGGVIRLRQGRLLAHLIEPPKA